MTKTGSNADGAVTINANGGFYGRSTATQGPLESVGVISGSVGSSPFVGSFGAHR